MSIKQLKVFLTLVVLLALSGWASAFAAPGVTWDLSQDLKSIPGYPSAPSYNSNTVGAWTFLYGDVNHPSNLDTFDWNSYPGWAGWYGSNLGTSGPSVVLPTRSFTFNGVNFTSGVATLFPGSQPVIVKWAGQATGMVRIAMTFNYQHGNSCPTDGLSWAVYKNDAKGPVRFATQLNSSASLYQPYFDIYVVPTDVFYFSVSNIVANNTAAFKCNGVNANITITQPNAVATSSVKK